jgi:tRNA-specific 2-thiouridylase
LPDNDYRAFLAARCGAALTPGPVIDERARVIGTHRGAPCYTIGQREGLGIAAREPLYVTAIDTFANTVTVGPRASCMKREFVAGQVHAIIPFSKKKVVRGVRIRYNHQQAPAQVWAGKGVLHVRFNEPQFAITPGQAAVIYSKDAVLGGGVIDRVIA